MNPNTPPPGDSAAAPSAGGTNGQKRLSPQREQEPSEGRYSLDEAYRESRSIVRQQFHDLLWSLGNLPRDRQRDLFPLLAFLAEGLALLDYRISPVARKRQWNIWQEDVRDSLAGRSSDNYLMAVADVVDRYELPRQFLFDVLAGVDMAIRCERFQAFDQWRQFSCRIGGSMMMMIVPVLGTRDEGYHESAIACGQAIQLTALLADSGNATQKLLKYIPAVDVEDCQCPIREVGPWEHNAAFNQVIRRQVAKIEKLFTSGGQLIEHLDFDGQRILRTLISMYWSELMKIKQNPMRLLDDTARLSRSEMRSFRMRHFLGTEGNAPILPARH